MDATTPREDRPGAPGPDLGTDQPGTGAQPAPAPATSTQELHTDLTQPTEVPRGAVPAAPAPAPAATPAPARPSGPNAGAIVLGLVCLAVALLAIVNETTSLVIDWSALGPGVLIAAGVLLVLVGVVGLARRER